MPKITYVDKKPFIINTSVPNENKISAEDMNQLKRGVNENETAISSNATAIKDNATAISTNATAITGKSKVSLNDVRTDIDLSTTRTPPTQANTVLSFCESRKR
ncbi:MAG: hypothetical protein RR623_07930 [Bacilli bacterium]